MVEYKEAKPKKAGRWGFCAIIRALAYTYYANLFVVPVAHALLLGLVKGFWNALLKKVRDASPLDAQEWPKHRACARHACFLRVPASLDGWAQAVSSTGLPTRSVSCSPGEEG